MSMLSAQCDELRAMAESVGLAMPQAATLMMEAADTITELRGALQVASVDYRHLEAENAKLRKELEQWHRLTAGIELPEYPITEFKPKDLERENAKLRELVRDVNKAAHMLCEAWEGSCSKEAEGMSLHAVCPISDTNELCVFGKLYDRMRELGVKVDE